MAKLIRPDASREHLNSARMARPASSTNSIQRRQLLKLSLGGAIALAAAPYSDAAAAVRVRPGNATINPSMRGMQLAITGSGSALPDPYRGGASCAVIIDGRILQFDFGRGVMENLMMVGINPMDIDEVYFTHLHFDHINDYDYYATTSWIAGRQEDVLIFGPPGTAAMSESAIKGMHKVMYDHIRRMHDRPVTPLNVRSDSPFRIREITPGVVVQNDSYKVTAAKAQHTGGDVLSLGYRIDSDYGSVAISGDTGPSDQIVELARDVDVLLHECTMPDYGMTQDGSFSRESVHKNETPGHTTPTALGELANKANVKMLVPYHLPPYGSVPAAIEMSSLYYGAESNAELWSDFVAAIRENYEGPLKLAEDRLVLQFN